MQSGQFITDRLMPKMIREICKQQGITFTSFSDDWLVHLEKDDKFARILGYNFSLNDSVAGNIAQDKVAAYELLSYFKVPAVPHYLIRTKANEVNWRDLPWSEGMVIKPLVGTSGHGVAKFFSADKAQTWMDKWGIEAWAASPLVEIKREVRLIFLDDEMLLAYEKRPIEIDGLKFFNLGKGAIAVNRKVTDSQVQLARIAKNSLVLRLCAVDLVELDDNTWLVLEINDGIMMENYARQSKENKAKTVDVYRNIIKTMF